MPGDAWRAAVAPGDATLHCAASMGMLTGALHRGRRGINGGDDAVARQLALILAGNEAMWTRSGASLTGRAHHSSRQKRSIRRPQATPSASGLSWVRRRQFRPNLAENGLLRTRLDRILDADTGKTFGKGMLGMRVEMLSPPQCCFPREQVGGQPCCALCYCGT